MPETEIDIKGLTKSFGPQTVLEDITCEIFGDGDESVTAELP